MTDIAPKTPSPVQSLRECLRRSFVWAAVMVVFSLAILSGALFAYLSLGTTSGMRNYALATGIAAGLGATICLAGAMHLLSLPLAQSVTPPRHVRWVIYTYRRVLMAGQLATMAVAATSAMTLIFGFGIPGI